MSNEEHCGEKKVYYCRDSGLLEHPGGLTHDLAKQSPQIYLRGNICDNIKKLKLPGP